MERPAKRRRLRSFPVFSLLPDEIASIIFQKLDVVSQIRLRRVCRKWNSLMCDRSILETVKLVEKDCPSCPDVGSFFLHGCKIMWNLCEAFVWRHVKHIIIEGDYDPSNEDFHEGDQPYTVCNKLTALVEVMREAKERRIGDFLDLETIYVRNGAVQLEDFRHLVENAALQCRLIVCDGSLVFIGDISDQIFGVEFPITGSRTFHLSGEMVDLKSGPKLSYSKYLSGNDRLNVIPVEIAQFIMAECDRVSVEMVAQLGEVFSALLKGRKGMLIRDDVRALFSGAFNDGPDPDKRHWEQCKQYDFSALNPLVKYAMVYYSRPWTCLRTVERCGYSRKAFGI